MMIQRHAFEKFANAYPQLSYRPDHVRTEHFDGSRAIHAFFDCVIDRGYTFDDMHKLMRDLAEGKEPKDKLEERAKKLLEMESKASRRYLSEDYFFCDYVQRIGLKVWFCPWMKLQHVGTYVFGGSLADLAAIGAPATADGQQLKAHRAASKPPTQPALTQIDPALIAAEEKRKKKAAKRAMA